MIGLFGPSTTCIRPPMNWHARSFPNVSETDRGAGESTKSTVGVWPFAERVSSAAMPLFRCQSQPSVWTRPREESAQRESSETETLESSDRSESEGQHGNELSAMRMQADALGR